MAIYNGLIEQGFSVQTFDVESTHYDFLLDPPQSAATIDDLVPELSQVAPMLMRSLATCDLVVINGEGTLHGVSRGPRNLLNLIRLAKTHFGKRVFLINHSCYPSNSELPADAGVEAFYKHTLSQCDRIVVREPISRSIYERLGLATIEGFDALPTYVARYAKLVYASDYVLIGTSAPWGDVDVTALAEALRSATSTLPSAPIGFLSGGKAAPASDETHFAALKAALPQIVYLRPASADEWLGLIAASPLVVTGRFHHLVAAACLRTPVVAMPSNTPKNSGLCMSLGWAPPITPMAPGFASLLQSRVRAPARATRQQVKQLAALAVRNCQFAGQR
jgi:polysaccharide pyruvyl transferase WcaK-like protein